MGRIFISYKTEDRPRAALLVAALEAEGLEVWWDQHIEAGSQWRETITEQLQSAGCVIVLWSRNSAGREGRFVQDEAERADRRGVYLPVRIDAVEMPLGLGHTQALSLIGWKGDRAALAFATVAAAARKMAEGSSPPARPVADLRASRPLVGRRALFVAAGALVVTGAVGVAVAPRSLRCSVGACWGPAALDHAIAVLSFRNLSGDPKQDYLSDGVSEDLRDALSRIASLKVSARTSSDAFKDARADVGAIAGKLGVAYVLDGSVRRAGDTLRVSAQLIEARTATERWSQTFDRKADDILAVQSEIATSVASGIQGKLIGADATAVARPPTTVPAAYDAYLRGRQIYDSGPDEAALREAIKAFDTALAADPNYAQAQAARARALTALAAQFTPARDLAAAYDVAVDAARRAVALAPDLADTQSSLGYALVTCRLDFAGAREPYERSLQAGPNDSDVLIRYGLFAVRTGRANAGLTALARAISLDPLNPRAYRMYGASLYAARRYADAIPQLRHALDLSPRTNAAHAAIGDSLLMLGRVQAARDEYANEPQALTRLPGLAIAERRLGHDDLAKAAYDELVRAEGDSAAYQQAQILSQWDDRAGALAALDHAERIHDSGLIYVRNDPLLDPLRGEPRFKTLLARLKLDS